MKSREALARAFPFPSPSPDGEVRWTGGGFLVEDQPAPVLSFEVDASGWSDDLTTLHEQASGANHPIDLASRARAIAALRKAGFGRTGDTLLEVGCSSGYFLEDARGAFPDALVLGSDYVAGPLLALAKAVPAQPLLHFDLTRCPLPDACLDAVVALNVLEHIKDDRAAVRELARVLKPGGVAVIELPAGPLLYDVYDQVLLHERRYTPRGARALFAREGFLVAQESHVGCFVFPAFAAVKLWNRRYLHRPLEEQRRIVEGNMKDTKGSRLMRAVMALETAGSRYVPYPFGIRLVLTARVHRRDHGASRRPSA